MSVIPAFGTADRTAVAAIRRVALRLSGGPEDYDALLDQVGEARLVLLGESSHGTNEFYRERARITQRLIAECGFSAVAIEGDWPDAYRVHRYVSGDDRDGDAEEALRGFRRFPAWMWRNAAVVDFVGWLRDHNDRRPHGTPAAGFFGLDLYSLHASMAAVVAHLDRVDPDAAARARRRYACLQPFAGERGPEYGRAVLQGVSEPCRQAVLEELVELRREAGRRLTLDGVIAEDDEFCAEQNATVVANAEEYYRTMFGDRAGSWNLRDRHMADTLDHLVAHLGRRRDPAKVVVWAHNSHVGDARATDAASRGELTLGQLARERHGAGAVLVGFTTYAGTVTAASDWDAPAERKRVRPALPGSAEQLLHETGLPAFLLARLRDSGAGAALFASRLHRALGVIYRPETERQSHYIQASPSRQFDALVHIDHTRAVEPLERTAAWDRGEPPETYPTAL